MRGSVGKNPFAAAQPSLLQSHNAATEAEREKAEALQKVVLRIALNSG